MGSDPNGPGLPRSLVPKRPVARSVERGLARHAAASDTMEAS